MWGRNKGPTFSNLVGGDPAGRNASSGPSDNVGVVMGEIINGKQAGGVQDAYVCEIVCDLLPSCCTFSL